MKTLPEIWLESFDRLWQTGIQDKQPGYPGDNNTIAKLYRDIGWQWYLDQYGGGGYIEHSAGHTMKWCGVSVAAAGVNMEGDWQLDPMIAYYCLPSCDRMADSAKWDKANLTSPLFIEPHKMKPGDIVTVGAKERMNGTHIVMCRTAPSGLFKTFDTIEGNAYGYVRGHEGKRKEGMVKNTRKLEEVARVYRPEAWWFVRKDQV